ncbi:hypothetical protein ABID82_005104 [Methylobacterium sp. PvP062]|mgnify:CR=1 FL=1|uniref:Uncharacterized protein n=1 Tax=Methylobacterium radiotolerans TaxID=31998 RepID=A0ABV2NU51_9HYPH|nr:MULTISPECIES: hypothetical protein [unclassified Methylobacterium]MBP2498418.1 hypothetical protein [Methylobacterium sp. PvP105]MBP2505597.1 hypothetical protein [Methylobacterium sp. PvP109]
MKERKKEDLALQISVMVLATHLREKAPEDYHEMIEEAFKKLKPLEEHDDVGADIIARPSTT